jgi:molybdenum cofactor guanylyltransferase
MENNNILGVVLAGGEAKRFGKDKSQVRLGNYTLIDHVLTKIIDQFEEILIVSNKDISFMTSDKITLISDYVKDMGPLGGVLSAMKWIVEKNKKYKWIATFPSDTPFFNKNIIREFSKKIKSNESLLYFVKANQKRHNIFGLWSIDLIKKLEDDLINKEERKVELWANKIGVKTINLEFDQFDSFFNINTTEDLEKAKKILDKKND